MRQNSTIQTLCTNLSLFSHTRITGLSFPPEEGETAHFFLEILTDRSASTFVISKSKTLDTSNLHQWLLHATFNQLEVQLVHRERGFQHSYQDSAPIGQLVEVQVLVKQNFFFIHLFFVFCLSFFLKNFYTFQNHPKGQTGSPCRPHA